MPTYATVQELAARINKKAVDDDIILSSLLDAAEETINGFCNRPDGFLADTTASARLYSGSGKAYQFIDECTSITLVAVKESATDTTYTSWAVGDWLAFRGDVKDPNFNGTPYTGLMVTATGDQSIFHSGRYTGLRGFRPDYESVGRGVPTVQVTAKWGYATTVPAGVKEATIMQASRWYKRFESAMADVLASGELGALLYRQSLDPDIKMLLVNGRYVKPAVGRR